MIGKPEITVTSDCQLARAMLLRVAREAIGEYVDETQLSWKTITGQLSKREPSLEPTVSLVVNAGSLEFTVDDVADYTHAAHSHEGSVVRGNREGSYK